MQSNSFSRIGQISSIIIEITMQVITILKKMQKISRKRKKIKIKGTIKKE